MKIGADDLTDRIASERQQMKTRFLDKNGGADMGRHDRLGAN